MNFKALIKTTEGAVVLGGLTLTVLSPILSSTIWAIITGIAYVAVNIPNIFATAKSWVLGKL
jgi:hypothetical protein